ncbi:MAG: thiamine pyrophosphate-binding protein [Chloroflexota bacterium]
MNGAEWLVSELQGWGVPFISVLSGNGLNPLLLAAHQRGLRLVDLRNEQAGSYMADAYARLTGRLGVCAVSSGIAHTNAFAGLLNAQFDGAPLLLITGCSPAETLGRGGFQDMDQVAMARPLCKYAALVTETWRIPQMLGEALAAATSGRPGSVHLSIAVDALSGEFNPARAISSAPRNTPYSRAAAPQEDIAAAARMLADARRPLIVAGSGVFHARGGPALDAFMRLTAIPAVTPIWDRGPIDAPNGAFLGVIGAATGEPDLLGTSDLLVLAGARVDYRVRYLDAPPLAAGRRLIRMDVDPAALGQGAPADLALLADPASAFQQLASTWRAAGHRPHTAWLAEARARHAEYYGRWARERMPVTTFTGWALVDALRALISDETVFLVDGGNIGQWAHMLLCNDRYPGHWLTCGASAVVGWGVAGAMAARLAYPTRPVLLLSGDGSIGFGLLEFESAARQGLPFVAIVADDRAWGIVATGQQKAWGHTVVADIGPIDYAAVARALGARGVRAETATELQAAVREGWQADLPTLIHVPVALGGPAELPADGSH